MRVAQCFADDGHDVTLIEAASELGGLAAPWTIGDVIWDRHYHVTLLSDQLTRSMYQSLGLEDATRWVETKTGYFGPDRQMRSVSNAIEFLRLPGLSLLGKFRLGVTIVYGSRIRSGARMEKIGVERWLRRWGGNSTFELFWKPLLRAKLGDEYPKASAAFIWATIQRLYAARRSGLKKEMFGYVTGGYASVCRELARWFADVGVDVRLATRVEEIRHVDDDTVEVRTPAGVERFDCVVVTTSAPLAALLCSDLLEGEKRRLREVEYIGIVCVSLLLRKPLAPYYLTYITDTTAPFTAVVEMTSFIDPAEVGGHALVYLPKYTTKADRLLGASDADVIAEFTGFLKTMFPALNDDDILAARVSRVPQVFAIPSLNYSRVGPTISTSVPGLFIAGSANLPFSTLNVNDTLALVDQLLALTMPIRMAQGD